MSFCGKYLREIGGGLTGSLMIVVLSCNGEAPPQVREIGASIIPLRLPERFGLLQRPAVEFDHAKHTAALKQQGCKACHPKTPEGALSAKLGRLEDGEDKTQLMELYHERCLGCHTDRMQRNESTGPLVCGECHQRRREFQSLWKPSTFDYPRHAQHVKTTESRCSTCHTTFDEQKKEMVYREGIAGGAGDYHGSKDVKIRAALRKVAHQTCIACHLTQEDKSLEAGPIDCEGCHGRAATAADPAVKKTAKREKIVNNQPEWSWIHAPGAKSALVAFDHQSHEGAAEFCSTCHHQTLRACKDCHTLTGGKKGGGVTLEMAYHGTETQQSCVGCHRKILRQQDCAGCHEQIHSASSDTSCKTCHDGPLPAAREGQTGQATARPSAYPMVPELAELPAVSEAFPEEVTLEALVDKYQASKFPHRKIVAHLDQSVRKSKLARRFHGNVETLCSGCHHHSPAGVRPPPCKSCHLDQAHSTKDKPSLKVAYHRQCLGCHQNMGLKETGCTDCHARAEKNLKATREVTP